MLTQTQHNYLTGGQSGVLTTMVQLFQNNSCVNFLIVVYRGCAGEENLPLGVKSDRSCDYMGPSNSLWWFCEGDSCNKGQLGKCME